MEGVIMLQNEEKNLYDRFVRGREDVVRTAAMRNATDEELSVLLGCGKSVVRKLKKGFPDFRDLLKINRDMADNIVESSLFTRAVGYDREDVITTMVKFDVVNTPIEITTGTTRVEDLELTEIKFILSKSKEVEVLNVLKALNGGEAYISKRVDFTEAFKRMYAICRKCLRL